MKNFYIISNSYRDPNCEKAKEIAAYIWEKGYKCDYCAIERSSKAGDSDFLKIENIPSEVDCCLVLGGDGTIIQVAGELAKKDIPMFGINLGNIGFLAEVGRDNIKAAIDRLLEDDFYIEERMMLSGYTIIDNNEVTGNLALNDVVITRAGTLRVIDYDIYVNDTLLTTVSGDGVIVSTPTGSTGYSMSAGGPIVEPGTPVILLTPVSAHKLNSRCVVLSPNDVITIEVCGRKEDTSIRVEAYFDAGVRYDMGVGDRLVISCARQTAKVIKFNRESFVEALSRKLKE